MGTRLIIKHMVCSRCIKVITDEFLQNGFTPTDVSLGFVEFKHELGKTDLNNIELILNKNGFELVKSKETILVEHIKLIIENAIDKGWCLELNTKTFSEYISSKLPYTYNTLSRVFSESEGATLESFIIECKIEKIKSLLIENSYSVSEISEYMGFSSVQHLSNQFKKRTGFSPIEFKRNLI
ncbi:MAG: AraC family transcriptional regulator [Candidatus Kapaibacterium sp.]|nr:AraC family transcriptional regulator [Bacteroidota bacterium]